MPAAFDPNAPGAIEPFFLQVLPQIVRHLDIDPYPLGQYLAEDVRNLLQGRRFELDNNRYIYFLRLLYNPGLNDLELELEGNNRINLYGLSYRIFALFSVFSPPVIAYLLANMCDGGSGLMPFIRALFRSCRSLLLLGIPIRLLTLSTRRVLLLSFRTGLRVLLRFVEVTTFTNRVIIPLVPNFV